MNDVNKTMQALQDAANAWAEKNGKAVDQQPSIFVHPINEDRNTFMRATGIVQFYIDGNCILSMSPNHLTVNGKPSRDVHAVLAALEEFLATVRQR
jgi:hypothetical protein